MARSSPHLESVARLDRRELPADTSREIEAGLTELLDQLTTLWAEEVVHGRQLTSNEPQADDGGVNGAADARKRMAAPDPQRDTDTRGLPGIVDGDPAPANWRAP